MLRLNLSQVEAQKAKARLAESQVKQAELNLSYTRITAQMVTRSIDNESHVIAVSA
ncbi:MAG: hypothetical protein P4L38_08440 [Syntrophaceae bacterium]|nr:hypothetical protein [Syntrophaceae bacterium]